MSEQKSFTSPRWTGTTKLVVALTVVVIIGALLVRFHTLIGPLLMAIILAYLIHPLASWLDNRTPLSWRGTVNIIYLFLLLILLGLLTAGGVGLVQQVQSLIRIIPQYIEELPAFIESVSKVYVIGPFQIDLTQIDFTAISNQVLSVVQPVLGQLGNLIGSLASSAATTLGWIFFILIVSYFILLESGGLRERIIQIQVPGYTSDLKRLGSELARIWNAFLRGQFIIFLATAAVYAMVLSILGVRYAIILALLTGFANFLPYIGPAINWVVLGLVTIFQPSNYFGLSPLAFTVLVVVVAVLIDQVFNNFVNPRIMADALKVHPAAVLVAALVAASLLGVLGVIVAAPLLATLKLVSQYVTDKMFDQEPFSEEEDVIKPPSAPRWFRRLKKLWSRLFQRKKTQPDE